MSDKTDQMIQETLAQAAERLRRGGDHALAVALVPSVASDQPVQAAWLTIAGSLMLAGHHLVQLSLHMAIEHQEEQKARRR